MKPDSRGAADSSKAASPTALVVAAYGRRGFVVLPDGHRLPYLVRGRQLKVCCGDRVSWEASAPGEPLVISSIAPRQNELGRHPARSASPETVAANVSHIIVVLAALPLPDLYVTDRYLCAARLMGARAALAWNKADTAPLPTAELAVYTALDYPVFAVSAVTGTGLAALEAWIGTGTGILVGQSGVGKSSLMNRLVPGANATTGEISAASDQGRHTTTASVLHALPGGGGLIDTPGVRDFVPALPGQRAIAGGFIEIAEAGRQCRFTDCSHLRESHCAVQEAVAGGQIDARRFESYRRLMNLGSQAAARSR